MYKINLDELENAEEKTLFCDFEDNIKEIDSIGPIKADLTIKSLGEFIEVKGNVNGKVRDRKSVVLGKECRSRWSPYH